MRRPADPRPPHRARSPRPKVLVVCASECNRRGMERPGARGLAEPVYHDYDDRIHRAVLEGPEWAAARQRDEPRYFDLERLVEEVVERARAERVEGLVVSQDYPGALVASLAARRLGLPGPSPAAVVACQHKLLSRRLQARLAAEATPRFWRLPPGRDGGPRSGAGSEAGFGPGMPAAGPPAFPVFAKPVRGNFSFGCGRVGSARELERLRRCWQLPEAYLRPLAQALELTAGEAPVAAALGDLEPGGDDGTGDLLLEELLEGDQVTVEAIASGGTIQPLAVVDSRFHPNGVSFERFRYPSLLPPEDQERMCELAARLGRGLGFTDGLFNVEMVRHRDTGALHVVEINPRMCSQWADLLEEVDGVNTYEHAVRVALGLPVSVPRRRGRARVGASFPLRALEDRRVLRAPTPEVLAAAEDAVGGAEAYLSVEPGRLLSELGQVQDGHSWCYGRVNLGGTDDEDLEAKLASFLGRLGLELAPADEEPTGQPRPPEPDCPPRLAS